MILVRSAPSKYRARPTVVDGIRFHSQKEAHRWCHLQLLERAGHISCLMRQVPYKFTYMDDVIFIYRSDFTYFDRKTRKTVVEDVKGFRTPLYKLKKRLIEKAFGIEIREV